MVNIFTIVVYLPKRERMIPRVIQSQIVDSAGDGKAIVVLGPRQTGKTTLLNVVAAREDRKVFFNCDDPFVRSQLEGASMAQLRQIVGDNRLVFIDEAQRVHNIGLTLKLLVDNFKDVQVLVSGSSALELANEVNEPLTGRKWEYLLLPVSWEELVQSAGYLTAVQQLEQRIVFGMYPEVITHPGREQDILKQLTDSYLYKDLLSYKGIRKPEVLEKLLRAMALQVGSEVSFNELASLVGVDKNTVSAYIDLLEKAFVVYKLQAFSRNHRNEINTGRKIYFYDNGVRNSLINNFNPINSRADAGALWENFFISERMKYIRYHRIYSNTYFWRAHQSGEIDYIEERGGALFLFECKWKTGKKIHPPAGFRNHYAFDSYSVATPENFSSFLASE